MKFGRHVTFWLITFLVICALLWLLREVLLPFVAGMAFAYIQAPLADRLERHGLNRTLASLLIVGVVTLALIAIAILVMPLVVQQGLALLSNMPAYLVRARDLLADPNRPWLNWINAGDSETFSNLMGRAASWLAAFSYSLLAGGKALVSFASILIIMPIVTFYLIADWHRMIGILDSWIPLRHRETARALAREIDVAISAFLRGQLAICIFLGLYYAIALTVVGLNFGVLIGAVAGLLTFVPYIGSLTGLLVGTSVAIAQFWPDWPWILAVIAIFVAGQFVEGNIIAPKIVGERVGLHPVMVIFAMFAFGYLFGFVGLIVAVPLAAAIAVLFRFGLRQYLASPLYIGEKPI
jgi:predicted PurR-regulated permease PerM